ncbi:unnamed protein product [Dovyalis caffra]|uniref:F-box associated beta-propeller type 1 domain-containing protein n=1 Tax=Dovyalis caffra TaxID=77055 RepID=A0AAV1QQW2_9ROSI|nr:unnamed protein product [Dovyalis caffra]
MIYDDATDDFESVTVLWNPASRKFKRLPKHDPEERFNQLAKGLGFDPKGNDYKYVRASVFGRYPRASILCEVIERNKGVWRRIKHDKPDHVPSPGGLWRIPKTASAAVQGALYWNIDGKILLSFSLLDDTFQWIPFPPPLNKYSMTGYNSHYRLETSCAWKESVAAVANLPNFRIKDQRFDKWVLNGSDKERAWSKLFTVTALVSGSLMPICLWRDREVVVKLSNEDGKKLVWLGIYGETGLSKVWEKDVYVYAWWNYEESLVEL